MKPEHSRLAELLQFVQGQPVKAIVDNERQYLGTCIPDNHRERFLSISNHQFDDKHDTSERYDDNDVAIERGEENVFARDYDDENVTDEYDDENDIANEYDDNIIARKHDGENEIGDTNINEVSSYDLAEFLDGLKRGCDLEHRDDESDRHEGFHSSKACEKKKSRNDPDERLGSNIQICGDEWDRNHNWGKTITVQNTRSDSTLLDINNVQPTNSERSHTEIHRIGETELLTIVISRDSEDDSEIEAILSEDKVDFPWKMGSSLDSDAESSNSMKSSDYDVEESSSCECSSSSVASAYLKIIDKKQIRTNEQRTRPMNNQLLRRNSTESSTKHDQSLNLPVYESVLLLQDDIVKVIRDEQLQNIDNTFYNDEHADMSRKYMHQVTDIFDDIIEDVKHVIADPFEAKFNYSNLEPIPKIVAVDLWSEYKQSVKVALQQLAEFCKTVEARKQLLDAGGHLGIVIAMKKWSTCPEIVVEGCNTLEKASRFTPFFADATAKIGAMEVILYLMTEYSGHEGIQAYGCSALCALAWSRPRAEYLVFDLNGLDSLYKGMVKFPYCTLLVLNVCWFLNHISAWQTFRGRILDAGMLGVLSQAIESYNSDRVDDKIIQLNAREAVRHLVSGP